ncbi:MAG TPA: C4-type zinc ribbon domain-containing protein [Chitinophagaceae bacterium]|nr:MAG: Zn-ribbon protein [Bacteroidetes bacterium OLB11]HMN31894.1 C4-type zinc ribbon domain-containing protein [Chitinophagaceae bacterium]
MAVKEFSVQEKLVSICTLQKIDSKIDEINKLRGELPMEVKDLEDELEGYNMRLNAIESEIMIIKEDIKRKKNIQAEAAEMLKKYEKQQNNVKNSREFEAINKEIEIQELEIKAAEKKIKDAKYAIEEQEKMKEHALGLIAEKQEVLKIKKTELKKIIEETEVEEKELLVKREEAATQVEARLLTAYEKIRHNFRNGLAVVAVERDSCGGCFNVVPPQRQSEIRLHKKMIVCEHCGRILVDSELVEGIEI